MDDLNSGSTDFGADITRIVEDSAKQNFSEKIIRGRGRPRKDGKPNKSARIELSGAEDPNPHHTSAPPPHSDQAASGAEPGPDAQGAFESIPKPILVLMLTAPFAITANRTGFDGFKLPQETAEECAPLLQTVIDQYLPNVDTKHLPLITLLSVLGMHTYAASMAYGDAKRAEAEERKRAQARAKARDPNHDPVPSPIMTSARSPDEILNAGDFPR